MAVVCFELRTWVDASTPQRGAQDTKPCQGNGGKAEVQNSEACKEMEADRQSYASFEGDCIMQCAMVVLIPASTQRMSKVAPRLCLLRLRAKCEPLLVQPLRAKREPLGFSEVKHSSWRIRLVEQDVISQKSTPIPQLPGLSSTSCATKAWPSRRNSSLPRLSRTQYI